MATAAQIHANRKNSTHSTGPTTDAGKATSSRNGLKHGLASGQLMIHGESEEAFNIMLAGLIAEHQAETVTEILLVQDMAKYHWLADRALSMQTREINEKWGHPPANLAVLIRYQTANERAFQRAFAALTALRKARLAEIGSASKQAAAAEDAAAKQRHEEWHASSLRGITPPTEAQMKAAGCGEEKILS
jgi:hypothetical protein